MLADIVECADLVGRAAHYQDRIGQNIEGHEVTHFGDVFKAPGLQPRFAPQLVLLVAGIVGRNIGFDADLYRLCQFISHFDDLAVFSHGFLLPF